MQNQQDLMRLDGGDTTFIIESIKGKTPYILYWGKRLDDTVSIEELSSLNARHPVRGSERVSIKPSLSLEPGVALLGLSGFSAHRDGKDWGSKFVIEKAESNRNIIELFCADKITHLSIVYRIYVSPDNGILEIQSELTNLGKDVVNVENFPTAVLPVPQAMDEIVGFTGRWSGEFSRERFARFRGGYVRENLRGRMSHDSFPGLFVCDSNTTQEQGTVYGFHLAWSGNHRLRVDTLNDGRVLVSLGALFFPGEIRLGAGESYESPKIIAGYSGDGLSSLSRSFHEYVKDEILQTSFYDKPRPVHLNIWEAVYFDHDVDTLKRLADKAAEIGVERFVLDDGWFGKRRSDEAGLGDWTVSPDIYPEGLKPLVDHVVGLGMEMGIWFEPEMVNADSDLYRAHPDWILQIENIEQIPFRNQFLLDIARPEVSEYLFNQMDTILSEYDIGYIKWDMNRDIHHPGSVCGRATPIAQVHALWALIDSIRLAHPNIEIESCASGGARSDYGVLARTDRVWISDCNDAIDRQSIQRGASHFLPLCVMGTHVGSRVCHQTGRTFTMEMRAATAMFGHMGLELNLLEEPKEEFDVLKKAIEFHKEHRQLFHSGDLYRLDSSDDSTSFGVVASDKSQAIFSYAFLTSQSHTHPDRIKFAGLDPRRRYRLTIEWPINFFEWRTPSAMAVLELMSHGAVLSGEILIENGLQLPNAFPQTVLIYCLVAVN